jgi:tRNA threonylcarbamoyladenosine biosynthesis protein TsaE
MIALDLPDEAATAALAARLAGVAALGDVIALRGELGAGKTSFARAFIHARGAAGPVPSPTFTLAQFYDLPSGPVWHFDFYRLKRPEEAWDLGIEDAFADGISLIEWPERAEAVLPADRIEITLRQGPAPDARRAELASGPGWAARLAALATIERAP